MEQYMMHLEEVAKEMGVKVHLAFQQSEEGDDWDWARVCEFAISQFGEKVTIVNCCGLGAEKLSGEKMISGRGLSVKVSRSVDVNHFVLEHGRNSTGMQEGEDSVCLTCVPRGTEYVLESNLLMGNCEEADISEAETLIEMCIEILPSLKTAKVETVTAGLRPFTEDRTIRIGKQDNANGTEMEMVANYGHGGMGVSLCWGCADEVAQIIAGTGEGGGSSEFFRTSKWNDRCVENPNLDISRRPMFVEGP